MLLSTFAIVALAQVTASTGSSIEGRQEVADPMVIEISLGADVDSKGQPRSAFNQQLVGKARAYPDTDRFVCDQARVRMLTVKKLAEDPKEIALEASATMVTDWPLQDIDLTIALVDHGGKEIDRQTWKRLTLGTWSRSYKPPKAEFKLSTEKWQSLFLEGAAPKLRITVDIQE